MAAWSPDSQNIASCGEDGTIQVWDAVTGKKSETSGSLDKTVRVWDALTGKQVDLYTYHSDEVYGVAWSPDGQRLASGSKDTTMQVNAV